MTDYVLAIIIGVLSSLLASIILLLALRRLRPNVEISPQIAKRTGTTGTSEYRIKVINRTTRAIVNVRLELELCMQTGTHGGMILKQTALPLRRHDLMEIPKYDAKDEKAEFAVIFLVDQGVDVEGQWAQHESAFVRFTLFAHDSFSGFGKVFHHDYCY